jgi:hypothetical protein
LESDLKEIRLICRKDAGSQVFAATRKLWTVRLKDKTDSYDALKEVLQDAKARCGRACKVVKADGDRIFGTSKRFLEIQREFGFVFERAAPHDHNDSAHIDRECRSLLEGTAAALEQSGAPATFWGEAALDVHQKRDTTA